MQGDMAAGEKTEAFVLCDWKGRILHGVLVDPTSFQEACAALGAEVASEGIPWVTLSEEARARCVFKEVRDMYADRVGPVHFALKSAPLVRVRS